MMLTMNCFSKTCINIPSFREVIIKEWVANTHEARPEETFKLHLSLHKYADTLFLILSLESML